MSQNAHTGHIWDFISDKEPNLDGPVVVQSLGFHIQAGYFKESEPESADLCL